MNPAPMPAATALYAALIGVLLLVLGARVARMRGRFQVGLGDGGNNELQRAMRALGNAVEWAVPGIFGRFTGSALSWGALAVLAIWNFWAFLRLVLV